MVMKAIETCFAFPPFPFSSDLKHTLFSEEINFHL